MIKNRRKSRFSLRTFVFFVAVSLLLSLLLHIAGIQAFITNSLLLPSKILILTTTKIYTSVTDLSTSRYELEIKKLQEQLKNLQEKKRYCEILENENRLLRVFLNLKKISKDKTIAAEILMRDMSNWYDIIILDKGSAEGIEENMAVLCEAGLIGRIIEVEKRTSKVLCISSPSFRIGVIIPKIKEEGLLTGGFGKIGKILYFDKTADVKVGDEVRTSGLDGLFPKNIYVGKIFRVELSKGQLYKIGYIDLTKNISYRQQVLCVK